MTVAIHWFRQDLRLADNPALFKAIEAGELLPVYILDDETPGPHKMGSASRWWLHEALKDLNQTLHGKLRLYHGPALDILPRLVEVYDAKTVSWTRCYEPWRIVRDTKLASRLESMDCETVRLNGSLLWEPWTINKADGEPYRVFTPFFRKGCLNADPPAAPINAPKCIEFAHSQEDGAVELDALALMPSIPWYVSMQDQWDVSEKGALNQLARFIDSGLADYKEGRNFPAQENVSRLSPYLHWGQISPNQVWHEIARVEALRGPSKDVDHFRSELGWREFSYNLLYHNPDLPSRALNRRFEAFDWRDDPSGLNAWQKGQTGIPIVDAGMRELWLTGYMHNRVRMIVASFLVKNLRIDWREGEAWFWDTLLDADLANNSASWQWVAGCGADAAPYFRIFNPVLQAEKFDPNGDYIRHYVPELSALPNKYLAKPWLAPAEILAEAGVVLGDSYPHPIADLKSSREAALSAFSALN